MMNIEIEVSEGQITCKITALEYSNRNCQKRVFIDDKRAHAMLIERELNPGAIITSSKVDNFRNIKEGLWVFEDANKAPPLQVEDIPANSRKQPTGARPNKRKNTRKSKKGLDNTQKDVIIEE